MFMGVYILIMKLFRLVHVVVRLYSAIDTLVRLYAVRPYGIDTLGPYAVAMYVCTLVQSYSIDTSTLSQKSLAAGWRLPRRGLTRPVVATTP
jgi:hypothetical protein